jgi:hypothetical protein
MSTQSLLLLHSIRGCSTLNSLSLEGNGFVKRSAQRKRVVEAQRESLRHQSGATEVDRRTPTSSLERAAARALSLLVGNAGNTAGKFHSSHAIGDPSAPSSTPRLRELCLKSYSSFVFGSLTIAAVVDALAVTSSLRVLDVAGNECGDALAQALGRTLPHNSSLRTLFWDDNCTSVDGFFAFYAGLLPNRSLTMVQMPIQDTRRVRRNDVSASLDTPLTWLTGAACASCHRSWKDRRTRLGRSSSVCSARSSR